MSGPPSRRRRGRQEASPAGSPDLYYDGGMIPIPAGWTAHFGANVTTLYPPDKGGRFRYFERLRPARSLRSVVTWVLAGDPLFRVGATREPARLVTAEGEYAALVVIEGTREGSPARRIVGAVFVEDFVAVLDVIALVPARFAFFERQARELLLRASFGLGARRRYFFYMPPPGWQALPAGAVASWYPPDFPANRSTLVVLPATPTTVTPGELGELLRRELASGLDGTDAQAAPEAIRTSGGVAGVLVRVAGTRAAGDREPMFREAAAFVVPPHLYLFRLESSVPARAVELDALLRAVAGSFKPLPDSDERRLGDAFAHVESSLGYWVD